MTRRLMITTAFVAVLALLSIHTATEANACKKCAKHNTSTEAKEAPHNVAPEGWTRLFDGESLVGWTIRSGKSDYYAKDGAITGTTKNRQRRGPETK